MHRDQLLSALTTCLAPHLVKDYCPNGLQVEGKESITHIVTGVTASQALIDEAVALQADAILVHHGYFWKNEPYNIIGMKKRRIGTLLKHDVSLFAYHLPIDVHIELGNNAQLGSLLGLKNIEPMEHIAPRGIVMQGELTKPLSHEGFKNLLMNKLGRDCITVGSKAAIHRVAWCTGGGQSFIDELNTADASYSVDAFVSGEISEQTTHSARELNIDYFAAGHHATERYGVKAVGEYLASQFDVKVTFVDIDNPA